MDTNINTSKLSLSALKIGDVHVEGITFESNTTDVTVQETLKGLMEMINMVTNREAAKTSERRQILIQDHANAVREYIWKKEHFIKQHAAWEQRRAEAQKGKPFEEREPEFDEDYPQLMF